MTTRYDAAMFDLDGTLADTLADIAAAANHTLAALDKAPIPTPRFRTLAGQGARWLIAHALETDDDALIERGLDLFRAYYGQHLLVHTATYPGVADMLDALSGRGVRMAVLSNKPDALTQSVVTGALGRWQFDKVAGHRADGPLKPDPAGALAIAQAMNVPPDRWLYVGDTRVDMLTANAAGMFAVGVLWGFRDEPELRDAGARAVIHHPAQLLDLLPPQT